MCRCVQTVGLPHSEIGPESSRATGGLLLVSLNQGLSPARGPKATLAHVMSGIGRRGWSGAPPGATLGATGRRVGGRDGGSWGVTPSGRLASFPARVRPLGPLIGEDHAADVQDRGL
jgi:hypothetical protein